MGRHLLPTQVLGVAVPVRKAQGAHGLRRTAFGLLLGSGAMVTGSGAVSIRGFAGANSTASAAKPTLADSVTITPKYLPGVYTTTTMPKNVAMLDSFFFTYWGIVIGVMLVILVMGYREMWLPQLWQKLGLSSDFLLTSIMYRRGRVKSSQEGEVLEMPASMYALTLLSAINQATFENGTRIPTLAVVVVCIPMAGVQLLILYLLLFDLDMHQDPVTRIPTPPSSTAWTVNCMKWLMMVVLSMQSVSEVDQAKRVVEGAYRLNVERFQAWRSCALFAAVLQYFVTICLVYTGAAVILNFRNSPDIIFCTLSLTFVSNVDDIVYGFFDASFDLEIDQNVQIREDDVPFSSIPYWVIATKRFASMFPLLLGYFVFEDACTTHVMPTATMRSLFRDWMKQ